MQRFLLSRTGHGILPQGDVSSVPYTLPMNLSSWLQTTNKTGVFILSFLLLQPVAFQHTWLAEHQLCVNNSSMQAAVVWLTLLWFCQQVCQQTVSLTSPLLAQTCLCHPLGVFHPGDHEDLGPYYHIRSLWVVGMVLTEAGSKPADP